MVAFIARARHGASVIRKVTVMSIRSHNSAQSGFTLIEMLVVLSIMAVVAGVGVQALNGVTNSVEDDLAHAEMNTIASAIQRFHEDTGYWPKQGPFASDTNLTFDHPARLAQLRVQPVDNDGDILAFDIASGTGWHGPYIRELDAATVSVGPMADGSGSPTTGAAVYVSGLGDPFSAAAIDETYFIWDDGTGKEFTLGRPYFYFIDATGVTGCQAPCLVSFGPNGEYERGGNDDIVVNIAGG